MISTYFTGGTIQAVEIRPWKLSYTLIDGSDNKLFEAWMGPIVGVLLPLLLYFVSPKKFKTVSGFFMGFCCVANGIYIGFAWLGPYGDCMTIMNANGPIWPMILFGLISTSFGLAAWHYLDKQLLKNADGDL